MEAQQISNYITASWLVIIGIAAILISFHLYYNFGVQKLQRQKQLESFKAVIEAEERQKKRIAQDLHDQVISILTVSGQDIQRYIYSRKGEEAVPDSLKKAVDSINRGISDIREITLELLPKTFLDFGLIKGIELYIDRLTTAGTCEIELFDKSNSKVKSFSESDQLNIYRIILEVLNNLHKHTGFSYLKITVDTQTEFLIFKFEHDGIEISNDEIERLRKTGKGLGLSSIQTRLSLIKGSIFYYKDTIELKIPIENA